MKKLVAISAVLLAAALLAFSAIAQQGPPAGAPQQGQGAPSRDPGVTQGRGPGIDALVMEDHTEFESIFDGQTLKGWDGDPQFWRVEDGVIIGESTAEKPIKINTFLIWRGGQPKDFELKLDYRMSATNSGVQYRSIELPDVGKWVLKGYQVDIDFENRYTGQLYEERGRGFLALRGQMTRLLPGKKQVVANLRSGDELKALIKANDWNQVHIIARGNVLTHIFNGQLMAQAIDEDAANRAMGGLLGLQLHVGPPMKLEVRNVWLKNL
jgi:hypothetical protein